MALKKLRPFIKTIDARAVKAERKWTDPFYLSPEYRAWREQVIARAGRRCQAIDGGFRCRKAEPTHRMFADHIRERNDGGDPLDPRNGQCLCGSHHSMKTAKARADRLSVKG